DRSPYLASRLLLCRDEHRDRRVDVPEISRVGREHGEPFAFGVPDNRFVGRLRPEFRNLTAPHDLVAITPRATCSSGTFTSASIYTAIFLQGENPAVYAGSESDNFSTAH
ncbi:hypothetical protein BRD04_08100, partial [Halobacteriales archaeon QS_9_67_17]